MTTEIPAQNPNENPIKFDASLAHHMRPVIRAVRGFPVKATAPDGTEHQMLGLADARQVSERMVVTFPGFGVVIPLLDGTRDVDQIVQQVGRGLTRDMLEQFIAQLDGAGLILGPNYDAMVADMRKAFDSQAILPPGTTAGVCDALLNNSEETKSIPEGPEREAAAARKLREYFDAMIAEALKDVADPALTSLPKAIVAPHLDYPRGGLNYAAIYGRLRVADRPDRIVILGTNHFGESTGVCGCDKGFSTALGECQIDQGLMNALKSKLGEALFANRFDHEREHSIELQIPWIQHVFGKDAQGNYPKVFAALVHDPVVANGESYDGKGVALQPFVDALKQAMSELPGRTLVICSADMSHVGPAFGDQRPLLGEDGTEQGEAAAQFRNSVFQTDDEMLGLVVQNKPAELVASMAWQQNPTRWCSVGNIVAGLMVVEPTDVRLLRYGPVIDEQGTGMVTSVAMVMN